ncbi:hypothetical protein [Bacillus paranthracis]|uniref:hypothetical protein n=1 Tax=Bacillus paranthracis TaxID=2026186 RepID=UPI000A302C3B|nr:hypothetical protein [Bacillus paranthracis]MCU5287981.1 hypothetical protein [Bacillus paranthracis]SME52439.1 hypothetical protein BACERE00176_05498 [Bacillus paranthracis]
MLEKHEILGTDKSIYEKQGEHHFDYEEIIHLNEDINDYVLDGYVIINKFDEKFFKPVYVKRV